jgi:K+-sensing histidine kinase KdpD
MMRATDKISVTIERKELASAKRLAANLGLSLSSFISDAVRERVREEARREAARKVVAGFAQEERASPLEAQALLESWAVPRAAASTRVKPRARPRRAAKGR